MPKPYTIRFGPWVPDLQDVAVEMPYQWSDTELPVADCQNVYWQDASYRCLPGLSSFGPSLGTPILDCFTWYDNTQQKEVLFAATANGFFTLIDGVWTEISTQTTEGVVGLSISMQLGSPQALATAMSPTSESGSGTASSYTFGTLSAVIGYGTATSYTWDFTGITGPGSWSYASGQGSANAVPQVTGSTSGSTSTATPRCTIVFGGVAYIVTGSLSYTQNTPSPITHVYTTNGSGTETVPSGGYSQVVIEVWGAGGGGSSSSGTASWLGGGGGGGYSRSVYSVSAGQTINYHVGAGGQVNINNNGLAGGLSSVTSGTLSVTTMTSNGGSGAAGNGTGGSASGGNQANAPGTNGALAGPGGTTTAGIYANNPVTNGIGGSYGGNFGVNGMVSFRYS